MGPLLRTLHIAVALRHPAGGRRSKSCGDLKARRVQVPSEADYVARGWSRVACDPKGALADFRKAAEINPRSLAALQNQAPATIPAAEATPLASDRPATI